MNKYFLPISLSILEKLILHSSCNKEDSQLILFSECGQLNINNLKEKYHHCIHYESEIAIRTDPNLLTESMLGNIYRTKIMPFPKKLLKDNLIKFISSDNLNPEQLYFNSYEVYFEENGTFIFHNEINNPFIPIPLSILSKLILHSLHNKEDSQLILCSEYGQLNIDNIKKEYIHCINYESEIALRCDDILLIKKLFNDTIHTRIISLPKILLNNHFIKFIANNSESPEKIYFNFLKIKFQENGTFIFDNNV